MPPISTRIGRRLVLGWRSLAVLRLKPTLQQAIPILRKFGIKIWLWAFSNLEAVALATILRDPRTKTLPLRTTSSSWTKLALPPSSISTSMGYVLLTRLSASHDWIHLPCSVHILIWVPMRLWLSCLLEFIGWYWVEQKYVCQYRKRFYFYRQWNFRRDPNCCFNYYACQRR